MTTTTILGDRAAHDPGSFVSNASVPDRLTSGAVQDLLRLQSPGGFRLPEELHAAREDLRRHETGEMAAELAARVVAAALKEADVDDFAGQLRDAEAARRLAEAVVLVLEVAREQVGRRVSVDPAQVVVECLQPAFSAAMADARAAAAILGDRELHDAGSFLQEEPKIRNAYAGLRNTAARVEALRHAQRAVNKLAPIEIDKAGYFRELRDPAAVGAPVSGSGPKPWPDDPLQRHVWMATIAKGNCWLPSATQQDERARQWLAERDRENPRRWTAAGSCRATYSPRGGKRLATPGESRETSRRLSPGDLAR